MSIEEPWYLRRKGITTKPSAEKLREQAKLWNNRAEEAYQKGIQSAEAKRTRFKAKAAALLAEATKVEIVEPS